MPRLILTFETMFQVLSADKLLREHVACRPTPTPAGLSTSICGVSIELLDQSEEQVALQILENQSSPPKGVHHLG